MSEYWLLFLLPATAAFAAAMDVFTMTIPNRISIAMVLGFIPAAWFADLNMWQIIDHAGAGLAILAVGIVLFARGWFGGGDAKLLAAVSLWVGFENLTAYMLWVAVAGGVLAILFTMARQMPLPRQLLGQAWAHRLHRQDGGIPYGVALAAGALLVYPQTIWFASLTH